MSLYEGVKAMNNRNSVVEEKINEIRRQTNSYLDEMFQVIANRKEAQRVDVISYFTSSLNISHEADVESLCLGSYHVLNIGNQPLHNPSICIQIPKDSPFSFSGKYVYEYFKQNVQSAPEWERFNETINPNEYWLRPLHKTVIEPNESIVFSDFQIRWSHDDAYEGSIVAAMFCDELVDGVVVVNPINLNGFSRSKEEQDE